MTKEEFETHAKVFKDRLVSLQREYRVELKSDPWDGSFDLYSTHSDNVIYNFKVTEED
jgi:hypothetical protein